MSLIVAIATTRRPAIVARTLQALAQQTRQPDRTLVCVADEADLPDTSTEALPKVEVLLSQRGLTRQRNQILRQLTSKDIVVFLDDDFLMAPDFLSHTEALFADRPDVVMVTGQVLADGISGPGLSVSDGEGHLQTADSDAPRHLTDVYNGYGCNMIIRAAPVLDHELRFDEALPLYGWLEDVDFSRQLAPFGAILKASHLQGVHLGTKAGRTPGVRLGYSQVANPVYLMSKRTMIGSRAVTMMARNLIANLLRSIRPEPWVDRRGRLRGNYLAMKDLVRGRLRPDRVLDL